MPTIKQGAGAAGGGVWELVEELVAASSASLDFTTLDYARYELFHLHADGLRPTVDNQLLVQVSDGAFRTADYDGWWIGAAALGGLAGGFAVLTNQAGALVQGGNQEAAAANIVGTNFMVEFGYADWQLDGPPKIMHLWGTGGARQNVPTQAWCVDGRWSWAPDSAPGAIVGIRLIYAATAIADGAARLYGRRRA